MHLEVLFFQTPVVVKHSLKQNAIQSDKLFFSLDDTIFFYGGEIFTLSK